MINSQLIDDSDKSIRTQITLSTKLKALIETRARKEGQSLSEYLRRAAILKLILEEQESDTYKTLADKLAGCIDLTNHPVWGSEKKINRYIRSLRRQWNQN